MSGGCWPTPGAGAPRRPSRPRETSLTSTWRRAARGAAHGAIENSVRKAGAGRVLFGTDMALLDARHQIGKVVTADISDDDKRKILGLNAIELLGLEV